jgi:phosphoenolpyruvate carboxylase
MIEPQSAGVEKFNNTVGLKFQLYNSLFLSLPFYGIDKTGILLSLFSKNGGRLRNGPGPGIDSGKVPRGQRSGRNSRSAFKFVQYVERQVVLLMLEDSAFRELNDIAARNAKRSRDRCAAGGQAGRAFEKA